MSEKDGLLNLSEAAQFLNISEDELRLLAEVGKIPAYKIGGVFLRFKLEQLSEVKTGIREKLNDLSTGTGKQKIYQPPEGKNSFWAKLKELWYFYDFYIIAFFVIAFIVCLIFKIGL